MRELPHNSAHQAEYTLPKRNKLDQTATAEEPRTGK
jgi:hypothetical protein